MRLVLGLISLILLQSCANAQSSFLEAVNTYRNRLIREKSTNSVKGIEFTDISRGTLLKIMAAFEEYFHTQLMKKKKRMKPVFQATFINNMHTYPFVYPQFYDMEEYKLHISNGSRAKVVGSHVLFSTPTKYPDFWSKTSLIQLLYSLWVNLTMIGIGLALGFSSVTETQFSTDLWMKTPPTQDEIAIVASSLSIAAAIGCIICGFAMDKFGRRPMMISCLLPMIVGWTYIGLACRPLDLIIGRVITGVGIGMAASPPRVFTTEITLPNMRATVGGISSVAIALGMTIQAFLGFLFYWRYLCLASAGYCLIVMFANCYLPESPYFVLLNSTIDDAKDELRKFRSRSYDINNELNQLQDFKHLNSIRRLGVVETLTVLLKSSTCKPFCIGLTYLLTVQLAGSAVVNFWTVDILKTSGATIDPFLGNLMLNVIRLVSCIGVVIILFWVTLRPMALISCVGVGCACVGLSIEYLSTGQGKIMISPEIGFIFYVVFGSVSFHSLPLMLLFETLPLQIRGVLGGIATATLFVMMFASCEAYPYLKNEIGFGYTFLFYGISSLLGCTALFFCLPETKGLTLQEIEEYYNNLRPTLTCQQRVMTVQKQESVSGPRRNSVFYRPKETQNKDSIESYKGINIESKTSTTGGKTSKSLNIHNNGHDT